VLKSDGGYKEGGRRKRKRKNRGVNEGGEREDLL